MHNAIERFRETIRSATGFAPEVIEPGKLHRFATRERRGNDDGWCRLFLDMRAGVYGCHRQGISETWTATDRRSMTLVERAAIARELHATVRERGQQQRAEWATNAKRNAELWAACRPVCEGDPVHRYLCRRLAVDDFRAPACLRFHPALDYWHERETLGAFPAMAAQVTAPDGRLLALHRTYLTDEGRKADVPTVKKLTRASGPLAGCGIRLASPRAGVLGVAEGIETALAASLASGLPAVAAYCANALAGFLWAAGVQRLVIFADSDEAGREAADNLKSRALRAWLRCDVMTPADVGADWCDVWSARGAITMEGAA